MNEDLEVDDIDDVEDTEEESTSVEGYTGEKVTSVLKAIKKHCLSCGGNQRDEVTYCCVTHCYLWPFRFGKNPYRKKREMTEEQKIAMQQRMSKMRNKETEG